MLKKTLALCVLVAACGGGPDNNPDASNDATAGCVSNAQCAAPTSICDTATGLCVECLETADCSGMPGTVCSLGSCECPNGDTYCGPNTCVDTDTSSEHCGFCTHACFGACSEGTCADPWEPTAADGAPAARAHHVAVWTGSRMIVWGGQTGAAPTDNTNTGAIYDPETYSWTAMSTVNAPTARHDATAVWTGTVMIVWGGYDGSDYLASGAVYDPAANTWTATAASGAPSGRRQHAAAWVDAAGLMVVWGGTDGADELNSGARFDPVGNAWTATAAPPAGSATRRQHSGTASGSSMLIYGGFGDEASMAVVNIYFPFASIPGGLSYSAADDDWTALSSTGQPSARARHSAVLADGDLYVFGGFNGASYLDDSLFYDGAWTAAAGTAPAGRADATAVYLSEGKKLIVWAGRNLGGALDTGGILDVATKTWESPPPTALSARFGHTALSTGAAMIVWGGRDGDTFAGDGAVYTPNP
jgi:hypothetical protein